MDLAEQVRDDMQDFKKTRRDRAGDDLVRFDGIFLEPTAAHQSIEAFEKALRRTTNRIAPSLIYAYAALMEGVPFANGAPNLTVDFPAMQELSKKNAAPDLRQGLQDRANADEDHSRAGIQGAHARAERLVLHQHSG